VDRFIVGTGRCGSTLLSRMLAEHRSLLMIFEFFSGLDIERRFGADPIGGEQLAELLSLETPALTMVMKRGFEIAEVVYPYGEHARYARDGAIPWIAAAALPRMSDDPDALFDATAAFASTLPRQGLADHYRSVFDWLAQRLDRTFWIEKSGSSIEYLDSLHDFFPNARFLHLHRDGCEAALSMREHHVYRLWVSLMFGGEAEAANAAIEKYGGGDPAGSDDPITQLLESRPPVEYFGLYWTQLIARGFRALSRLDANQYLEVRFEDLVACPAEVLADIADFFALEAEDDGWIERAVALVRGIPPTRFDGLASDERERLADSCRVGRQLLGQVD
jgi:putative sulfotransferase